MENMSLEQSECIERKGDDAYPKTVLDVDTTAIVILY
jgi:hypothetical protein